MDEEHRPPLLDLELDKSLLNPFFESYRLSIDALPMQHLEFNEKVLESLLNYKHHYSYIHHSLFANINHLHSDQFNDGLLFFMDAKLSLQMVQWNSKTEKLQPPQEVFNLDINQTVNLANCAHHVNISFPDKNWALVLHSFYLLSDETAIGTTFLYLISTPNRGSIDSCWKLYKTFELNDSSMKHYLKDSGGPSFNFSISSPARIMCSNCSKVGVKNETQEINVILVSVQKENVKMVDYDYKGCPGDLEEKEKHLCILTWLTIKLQMTDTTTETEKVENKCSFRLRVLKSLHYPEYIAFDRDNSSIVSIISEGFYDFIFDSLNHIEEKPEKPYFEKVELCEEPANNPMLAEEDCDRITHELRLIRYDGEKHEILRWVHMCGHEWLFSLAPASDGDLPQFVLRHDVDAIVWNPLLNGDQFIVDHRSTFPALGYVQASKVDKKFISSSTDFTYAALVDATHHLYVYMQPSSGPNDQTSDQQMKNRKTGQRVDTFAKQFVVKIGDRLTSVLGLYCDKKVVFVLTSDAINCVRVH